MGYLRRLFKQDAGRTARVILFIASLGLIALGLDILIEKQLILSVHPVLENFIAGGMVLTGIGQAATLGSDRYEKYADVIGYAFLALFAFFIIFRIVLVAMVTPAIYLVILFLIVVFARFLLRAGG